jgi:DNA polymerase-3 subunit beta
MSLSIYAPIGVIGPMLRRAQGVAPAKADRPILGCVLLSAGHDGVLTVTASSGTMTLIQRVSLGLDAVRDTGDCAIDARRIAMVVGGLPGDTVELRHAWKAGGGSLNVKGGGSTSKLNTMDAADYPPQASGGADVADGLADTTVIKGGDLARMIAETAFAICEDANRYGLNGLLIESVEAGPDGGARLRFATTDGSRLSWSEGPASAAVALGGRKKLLSRVFLAELGKLISGPEQEWTITIGARWISAQCGDVELSGVLVEGEFPDYRQVLPAGGPKRVATVGGPDLAAALKRAALMASDRNTSVRLSFGESVLTISAQDLQAGSVVEEVACVLDGRPIETGFNARYLLDILSATKAAEVRIEMGSGALDPVIVKADGRQDAVFVVMPMRLD